MPSDVPAPIVTLLRSCLDGEPLFYSTPNFQQMLAVPVQSGTTLAAGQAQALFEFPMFSVGGTTRPYDLAPDGRFFIIRDAQTESVAAPPANMILVLNWFEELKRLVPVK